MSAKNIVFSNTAREAIFAGVTKLANAVRATMGPKGRNVLIQKSFGGPAATKDGVTVAKEIELTDATENMGAQLVKEAATKTNDAAGDGTTTATVLAHAMMEEGLKHLSSGSNPIAIKRGIEKAVDAIVAQLDKMKKPVKDREQYAAVANISAQDQEVGDIIAEVIEQAGSGGVITVEDGQTTGMEKEFVEGMQFDNGYISPYFMTDPKRQEAVFENPSILITDKKISSIKEILPLLESLAQAGQKEVVIIAEDVDGEALATLVVNKMRGAFSALAVKAPAFGDRRKAILQDIAVLTGGRVISEEVGLKLENATVEDLGRARRVVASKDVTQIVDGAGSKNAIATRVKQIENEMVNSSSDYDKEKLQERMAKMSGGVAIIKVGAATELEQREKKDRVIDALSATRAAAEEGIVPGGGTAYIRCVPTLDKLQGDNDDEQIGIEIVKNAITAPARYIADNAGVNGDVVIEKVLNLKGSEGYNALTGTYGDLIKDKVIDPKKVTRTALENAASVAAMFLTLEVAITSIPEEKPAMPDMGAMGGMGGMGGMM